MRALIQRVSQASVEIDSRRVSQIGKGLLVFLGIGRGDSSDDIKYIANKILNLRVFPDGDQNFNRSLLDISGELLIVSQFTLYGDCRKGRRPSFDKAENPSESKQLYDDFITFIRETFPSINIKEGVFQADMDISLVNDGPVTFILDSSKIL